MAQDETPPQPPPEKETRSSSPGSHESIDKGHEGKDGGSKDYFVSCCTLVLSLYSAQGYVVLTRGQARLRICWET